MNSQPLEGVARRAGGPADPASHAVIDPWIQAMREGRFDDAWRVSDAVLRRRRDVPCSHLPRHEQYFWKGDSLAGKRVLVRCYHGLGDTVQFIRYAAMLRSVAAEVILWAQPQLIPLLEGVAGIDRLLPLHEGAPDVAHDAEVELMELPHVFRSVLHTLPASVPYLPVAFEARSAGSIAPRDRPSGLRLGIVWRSGSWDDRRSVPVESLAPLAAIAGVKLVALQYGPALAEWPAHWGPIDSTPDAVTLARRMCALDGVITVDSFPAHLAGALGRRTWTLLHADPDWRWMTNRPDSPWYPTMRLVRQREPGDWRGVISRVAAEVADVSRDRTDFTWTVAS